MANGYSRSRSPVRGINTVNPSWGDAAPGPRSWSEPLARELPAAAPASYPVAENHALSCPDCGSVLRLSLTTQSGEIHPPQWQPMSPLTLFSRVWRRFWKPNLADRQLSTSLRFIRVRPRPRAFDWLWLHPSSLPGQQAPSLGSIWYRSPAICAVVSVVSSSKRKKSTNSLDVAGNAPSRLGTRSQTGIDRRDFAPSTLGRWL